MRERIYVDCGFYSGGALEIYLKKKIVNSKWTFYAFEPSPDIDLKLQLAKFPFKIKLFKKAVWIKDGKIPFWTSNRHNSSSVEGTSSHAPKERLLVPCVDFSKFIASLPEDAYIICSMDIEGSEYPVLEKLLQDGNADRIDVLDIEFHHRFMLVETKIESQALIDRLEAEGVKVKLKVPLE